MYSPRLINLRVKNVFSEISGLIFQGKNWFVKLLIFGNLRNDEHFLYLGQQHLLQCCIRLLQYNMLKLYAKVLLMVTLTVFTPDKLSSCFKNQKSSVTYPNYVILIFLSNYSIIFRSRCNKAECNFFLEQNKVRSCNTGLRIQKPTQSDIPRSSCNLQHHLIPMKSTFSDFSTIFLILFFWPSEAVLTLGTFFKFLRALCTAAIVLQLAITTTVLLAMI